MKKFIGIISIIVYLISANALVHASSMGFFNQQQNTTSHCHQLHTTTDQTPPDGNNIDCCELVYSNQYSLTKITFEDLQKNYFSLVLPHTNQIFTQHNSIIHKPLIIQSPPGRKTDNKYNNFSDLAGIIVNVI